MTTPITKEPLYAEVHNVPDDYHFTDAELERIMAGDMFTPRQGAIMAREIQERRKADAAWKQFQGMLNPDDPAAPPAPLVPDEMKPTVEAIKRVLPTSNPDEYAACIGADMWNACRAAMLNHSDDELDMVQRVSQPYKLPENSFTDAELEMMSHGDNPQANAYRELLAFRRDHPVIPDGSANMLRRWLAFGRALQSSGSQLPRHLIAETESMLAAPQQEVKP